MPQLRFKLIVRTRTAVNAPTLVGMVRNLAPFYFFRREENYRYAYPCCPESF